MANELIGSFSPTQGFASVGNPGGGETQPFGLATVGVGGGASFKAGVTGSMLYLFRVPNAAALATGITTELYLADDVLNAGAGKVSKWDVTFGPVTSGTSPFDETVLASSTATTGTITSSATAGQVKLLSIATVVASTNSLAAGNTCLMRIRRLGTDAADTSKGNVVLLNVDVRNT